MKRFSPTLRGYTRVVTGGIAIVSVTGITVGWMGNALAAWLFTVDAALALALFTVLAQDGDDEPPWFGGVVQLRA